MASPCQILMATNDQSVADKMLALASQEAWRIEEKYSRYRNDSIVSKINGSDGEPISLDDETSHLLDFAKMSYELTDGLFDITSGVLRKVWQFDKSGSVPSAEQIAEVLPHIGFEKLIWNKPSLTVKPGMQIDLGGIGKEYAVDRVLNQLQSLDDIPLLVNFGGDIAANRPQANGKPWLVGIERPSQQGISSELLEFWQGGLATSGSTYRFLLKDGERYGHVLNPKTGWPIAGAPLSVTVSAQTCTQAGMLATFSMLQGEDAEDFLADQGVETFWCIR